MLDLLAGFVTELRNAGLPVSLTENLDAMEAVQHIPIEDREAFKYALGATMVKNNAHWRAFETVFEVYFSLRGPEYSIVDGDDRHRRDVARDARADAPGRGQGRRGGSMDSLTPEEIAQLLMQALMNGDQAMMRALAKQAVQRFAGMEPGRPVGGTYYLYRTLRNLDLDGMLEKLMEASREQVGGELTPLEERLEHDEYNDRIEQFKKEIEAEIRRRLVADRGAEAMAKTLRKPLPEDVEFMHASRDEMQNLKKALYPLTRKLAARLARKRRHGRKGPLDFRNTVRHSLSYGGVPAEPKFKYPRPAKPELMVVADISGSVAAFARFTLMLVYAIQGQFSQGPLVRVHRRHRRGHRLLQGRRGHHRGDPPGEHRGRRGVGRRAQRLRPRLRGVLGALRQGHRPEDHGAAARRRAQQLPRQSQAWVVKEIRQKARHVYWLNPEPKSYWNTGDSIVGDYGTHTDGVYECRNLRQLEGFVEKLA